MNSTLAKAVFGVGVALAIASIASIYITMMATQNTRTTDVVSSQQPTSSNSRTTSSSDTNQKNKDMNATGTVAGSRYHSFVYDNNNTSRRLLINRFKIITSLILPRYLLFKQELRG